MNVGHSAFVTAPRSVKRHTRAVSQFLQLSGGILVSAIAPFLLFFQARSPDYEAFVGYYYVLWGTAAAVLVGHYFYARLVYFPGARATSYIAPTFCASFAAVLAIFFFLRIDYGRAHFVTSWLACLAWYYGCHFVSLRTTRPRRLGIVPIGAACSLESLPHIDWVPLNEGGVHIPGCDGIVADFRADLPDEWERLIAETVISGVPVYHFKQIQESLTGRVDIEHLSENNFGSLIPGAAYIALKQAVDTVSAIMLGAVLLPALLVVGIAIKLSSRGPMLFHQRRMGYRGRIFTIYKFRTMRDESRMPESRDSNITRDGDDRVTPIGRFLRRTRIDELPQIINILRGEMSWIGPRPEAVPLSEWYEAEIPFYRYRHIVRPGITGWAQVNQGHVCEIEDVLAKLQYDFYYVRYFSPWLDVLIMLRTARTVLTGFGSK
jgi:lipopolysaccharide/colanic/teichoic acid biosynthesis glycosyltransferase